MTWWDNFVSFTRDQVMPFFDEFFDVLGIWLLLLFFLFFVLGAIALIIAFFAEKIYWMFFENKLARARALSDRIVEGYFGPDENEKGGDDNA